MLAMLEARFRKMLEMQEEVYDGTVRIDKVPMARAPIATRSRPAA